MWSLGFVPGPPGEARQKEMNIFYCSAEMLCNIPDCFLMRCKARHQKAIPRHDVLLTRFATHPPENMQRHCMFSSLTPHKIIWIGKPHQATRMEALVFIRNELKDAITTYPYWTREPHAFKIQLREGLIDLPDRILRTAKWDNWTPDASVGYWSISPLFYLWRSTF